MTRPAVPTKRARVAEDHERGRPVRGRAQCKDDEVPHVHHEEHDHQGADGLVPRQGTEFARPHLAQGPAALMEDPHSELPAPRAEAPVTLTPQ